jgi:hypothetical protein
VPASVLAPNKLDTLAAVQLGLEASPNIQPPELDTWAENMCAAPKDSFASQAAGAAESCAPALSTAELDAADWSSGVPSFSLRAG